MREQAAPVDDASRPATAPRSGSRATVAAGSGGAAMEEPSKAEHRPHDDHDEHRHGQGCGHRSMPHGDHTDFIHNGHRHAEHAGHWDEHGAPEADESMDWEAVDQAATLIDSHKPASRAELTEDERAAAGLPGADAPAGAGEPATGGGSGRP